MTELIDRLDLIICDGFYKILQAILLKSLAYLAGYINYNKFCTIT